MPSVKLKAVVVDDEPLARQIVQEYLGRHQDIEVVAECANGFEVVKTVTELEPDMLFLDIQMPKLNGFEVLELIDRNVAVVFTTAHDEFAVKAFEVHAIDYLLKPFSQERFDEAVERARRTRPSARKKSLDELANDVRRSAPPLDRILIRDGAKVHIIPAASIDYIEAQDDYVSIKAEGRRYLKQTTLSALEKQLDASKFIRIHRSYILNVERLAKIEPYAKDSRVVILKDGTRLRVSRAGYRKLITFL